MLLQVIVCSDKEFQKVREGNNFPNVKPTVQAMTDEQISVRIESSQFMKG